LTPFGGEDKAGALVSGATPGWYPDPSGQAAWRYWDGSAWTAHQSPASPAPSPAPVPEPPFALVSDSTLIYLFAPRFAKPRPLVGLRVPCPPSRVDGPRVASEMLGVAWWSLREAGAVRIESAVGERKTRLQALLLNPEAGSHRRSVESLEAALLRLLRGGGGRANLGGMNSHFHSSPEAPYGSHEIANFARTEGAAAGYVVFSRSSALTVRGDCDRIARLAPQFDALWERWQRFAQAEQPLHALLMQDAASSVPGYWG
jgi:hypothetical protein